MSAKHPFKATIYYVLGTREEWKRQKAEEPDSAASETIWFKSLAELQKYANDTGWDIITSIRIRKEAKS